VELCSGFLDLKTQEWENFLGLPIKSLLGLKVGVEGTNPDLAPDLIPEFGDTNKWEIF